MSGRLLLTVLAAMLAASPAMAGSSPVVLELFTSEGCSSCPPADKLLAEYVQQDKDVLALSWHVDYWNRLGWADPFSSPAATRRQTSYNQRLGRDYNYTPQMVIQGQQEMTGSDVARIAHTIDAIRHQGNDSPHLDLDYTRNGTLKLHIGTSHTPLDAIIMLVQFDAEQEVDVTRGENARQHLRHVHVVRDQSVIGEWKGEEYDRQIDVPVLATKGGWAILVQDRRNGRIITANSLIPG